MSASFFPVCWDIEESWDIEEVCNIKRVLNINQCQEIWTLRKARTAKKAETLIQAKKLRRVAILRKYGTLRKLRTLSVAKIAKKVDEMLTLLPQASSTTGYQLFPSWSKVISVQTGIELLVGLISLQNLCQYPGPSSCSI
jgi:hypothetical protein